MTVKNVFENGIIPMPPTADHSEKKGCFVKNSSGSAALCTAATDLPVGPIVDGDDTTGNDSVAMCGATPGVVPVKLGAANTAFGFGVLASDGERVIDDPGTGARVRVCRFIESGAENERVLAILMLPLVLS